MAEGRAWARRQWLHRGRLSRGAWPSLLLVAVVALLGQLLCRAASGSLFVPSPPSLAPHGPSDLRGGRAGGVGTRSAKADSLGEATVEAEPNYEERWENLPIIASVTVLVGALLTQQDLVAIFALYYFQESMEADWLVESAQVLSRLPVDLFVEYRNQAILLPVLTKAATSGVAYVLGDILAQVFEGRRRVEWLDLGRSTRNGIVGFFLHGPGVHFWLLFLEGPFQEFIGSSTGTEWWAIVAKILVDQTFFAVVLTTLYALFLGALSGKPLDEVLSRTWKTLLPALYSSWRFWPFVHLITFSPMMPFELKVLWNDVVEIVWVVILSLIANDEKTVGAGSEPKGPSDSESGDAAAQAAVRQRREELQPEPVTP